MPKICPWAKYQNSSMGGSFWQKDSLITHILFDTCLFEIKWNIKLGFIFHLYLKTKQKRPKSQNNTECLIFKVNGLYHLHRLTIFFELLTLDAWQHWQDYISGMLIVWLDNCTLRWFFFFKSFFLVTDKKAWATYN